MDSKPEGNGFLVGLVVSHDRILERLGGGVNHPHICTIHDIDEHDGQHFMAIELLKGQTLKNRFLEKRMGVDEILAVAPEQLASLRMPAGPRVYVAPSPAGWAFLSRLAQLKKSVSYVILQSTPAA